MNDDGSGFTTVVGGSGDVLPTDANDQVAVSPAGDLLVFASARDFDASDRPEACRLYRAAPDGSGPV